MGKQRISASFLEALARCGMQAYYAYIERLRRPPGVAQLVGTATHQSACDDLTAKIETGALLEHSDVLDAAASAFDDSWDGEPPDLSADERKVGTDKVRGQAKDQVIQLAALHHEVLAPQLQPTGVEARFDLELGGFPFNLSGYRDVDEVTRTRDLKTTGKTPSPRAAEQSVQLEVYALSRKVRDGKPVEHVTLDFLVKTKTPSVVIAKATPPPDFGALFERIEAAAHVMETGAFYPTDPGNWVCQEKYCGYWNDVCPYGRRRRTQA